MCGLHGSAPTLLEYFEPGHGSQDASSADVDPTLSCVPSEQDKMECAEHKALLSLFALNRPEEQEAQEESFFEVDPSMYLLPNPHIVTVLSRQAVASLVDENLPAVHVAHDESSAFVEPSVYPFPAAHFRMFLSAHAFASVFAEY